MFKLGRFFVVSSVVSALDISDDDRALICDTTNHPYPPHRRAAIRWLHVPKTRTTFVNTIWHYGCNIDPTVSIADFDRRYDFHLNETYPIGDWCPKLVDHTPGTHKPIGEHEWTCHKGHFVTMVREPSSRITQAYHEAQCVSDCNPENAKTHGGCDSVNEPGRGMSAACNALQDRHCPAEYAEDLAAQACQTKMILGYPCSASMRLTTRHIEKAVDRVRSGFAFIGLVEEWDLSLCLFHRILGGDFYPVEISREQGQAFALPKDCPQSQDVIPDDIDQPVYDAAKEFFEHRVHHILRVLKGEVADDLDTTPDLRPPECFNQRISLHA